MPSTSKPADGAKAIHTEPARYHEYWEEMPCYLSVHDRDFRIIDGNRRFRADFGESTGEYCYKVYKRRDEVCPNCPVEETFNDGRSHGSEQLLTTLDGTETPVMVHTTPIHDDSGEVVAVMEMHAEIGEVKKLQEELQRSQTRMVQFFEEVPCFITVQGPDRVIRNANRKFRETFGLDSVGKTCFEMYKHREEQCLVCPSQKTFETGEPQHHEEVLITADGDKLNALCTTAPLRNGTGQVEEVMEMCIDITEMRELQSQLTSIGLLVGSISHGIKGLLTGLDGGIYMVNSGFEKDKPERVKKGWEMVQRNVERIRSMVLDILYYAKDRELRVEDVDVADVGGAIPGEVQAIRAMLLNLLENSLDACRADSKKDQHRIRLAIRRAAPWLTIDVEDNGIGMDRETREKAFSLFFSSKGLKGTGLGLFISNKIVDKHGGSIGVESEPGQGTRFLVRLPLEAKPSTKPDEE
jgi:PAS domain S-box-containing protein